MASSISVTSGLDGWAKGFDLLGFLPQEPVPGLSNRVCHPANLLTRSTGNRLTVLGLA